MNALPLPQTEMPFEEPRLLSADELLDKYLIHLLTTTRSITVTARIAKLNVSTVRRRLARHGLEARHVARPHLTK